MAGRKVRDEHEARTMLAAATESGIERAVWARQHGVDGRSLNAWSLNLARREFDDEAPYRLLELVAGPPERSPARRGLTVRCGPFAVEVDHHVDDALLARVLVAIASC